jgi:ubiquinone/menaquinone biosynthesis C-methylase UbiE
MKTAPWWAMARSAARVALPASTRRWIRKHTRLGVPSDGHPGPAAAGGRYEALYEAHAQVVPGDDAVGAGDFDRIGRIELGVLLMEGLCEDSTLVDFGCGTGRLAVHAVKRLSQGHYIGIDISPTMLDRARQRLHVTVPCPAGRVSWLRQATSTFALDDASVDMVCVFSVFTHMEPEDCYHYLVDARRITRPEGRLLLSCLTMDLPAAREIFLASASVPFDARWNRVRSFTTSAEMMNAIAELAGWQPRRWYRGDEANIRLPESNEMAALGQSTLVLSRR